MARRPRNPLAPAARPDEVALPDGQRAVVVVWDDSTWDVHGGLDAVRLAKLPGHVLTVPVDDVLSAANRAAERQG